MIDANGWPFSTLDQDNDDMVSGSCSQHKRGGGGWWFRGCGAANLNGQYGKEAGQRGILWYHLNMSSNAFKGSRMMLRPVRHTDGC